MDVGCVGGLPLAVCSELRSCHTRPITKKGFVWLSWSLATHSVMGKTLKQMSPVGLGTVIQSDGSTSLWLRTGLLPFPAFPGGLSLLPPVTSVVHPRMHCACLPFPLIIKCRLKNKLPKTWGLEENRVLVRRAFSCPFKLPSHSELS